MPITELFDAVWSHLVWTCFAKDHTTTYDLVDVIYSAIAVFHSFESGPLTAYFMGTSAMRTSLFTTTISRFFCSYVVVLSRSSPDTFAYYIRSASSLTGILAPSSRLSFRIYHVHICVLSTNVFDFSIDYKIIMSIFMKAVFVIPAFPRRTLRIFYCFQALLIRTLHPLTIFFSSWI